MALYSFEFSLTQRGEGVVVADSEEEAWDLISENLDKYESRTDLDINIEEV